MSCLSFLFSSSFVWFSLFIFIFHFKLKQVFAYYLFCVCVFGIPIFKVKTKQKTLSVFHKEHFFFLSFQSILLHSDISSERRLRWEKFTRYITYLGLCIATCLTFKSSTWIASIIGLAVALYITISEYWLNANPSQARGSRSLEELFTSHD